MTQKQQAIFKQFEEVLHQRFNSMKELEEVLSEKFQEEMEHHTDAQAAYNSVNDETNGLLGQYFCYTLSEQGESWSIGEGENFDTNKSQEYIQVFSAHYGENFETVDDLFSKLENKVSKDMCNSGCDMKNALQMILEEDLGLEDVFIIIGADAEPRIEYISA